MPPQPHKKTRPRVFYGWIIVMAMASVGLVQAGITNPANGIFIKPVTEAFGWSRSLFVGAISAGTLVGGGASLVMGPALDRYGPRWIVSIGLLVLGGALMALAFIENAWQFYIAMMVGRAVLQSSLMLSAQVVVPKWFVRQRGRAVAISGIGMRTGNSVSPLIAQGLLTLFGWRSAFFGLGVIVITVALLPSALFLRRSPEDLGLQPDGDTVRSPALDHTSQADPVAGSTPEVQFTLRQAVADPTFWLVTLSSMLGFIVVAGINLNLVAYLQDQGLSSRTAVLTLTTFSLVSIPSALAAGFLSERVPIRPTLIVTYIGMALSVLFLLNVDSTLSSILYAVYFGLLFGVMITLFILIFPDFFGRQSLGAIRGLTSPLQMGAIAVGPLVASVGYDITGEYTVSFFMFFVLFLLAGFFLLMARKPTLSNT